MKKVSNLEVGAITYFLIRAYFVGISFRILSNLSLQSSFISMIVGLIIGIFYLLLILYILEYEKDLTIIEKNKKLYGNTIGNILNAFTSFFILILILLLYTNILSIIHSEYLNKTPIILISIYFIITIFYCTKSGIYTISKSCLLLIYISFILIIAGNISLLFQIDYNNFMPFNINNKTIFSSLYYLSYNIIPLYMIGIIPKARINKEKKLKSTILIFYVIANITLIIENLNIIGILGINLCKLYRFPEFQILKNISLVGLSSRIDSIFFIKYILDIIIFIILGSYYIISTLKSIIKKRSNIIIYIYCFILFIASINLYNTKILNTNTCKSISIAFCIFMTISTLFTFYKIKHPKKVKS